MTEPLPPEDPRDALIREQAALLKEQAEQIAALTALVAELREQRDAARRAASRNSGNSSMPPSADDLPGRRLPAHKGNQQSTPPSHPVTRVNAYVLSCR